MPKITLEAKNENGYPFTFYIEKAVPLDEDGKMIVEGIASTVNVDHDNERMAEDALHSMADIINNKGVPLRLEHKAGDEAVLGNVYQARVDERNQLWIKAAIDPTHPAGPSLHSSLKQGAKLGLSVGGRVKNAVRELVESTGNYVKTFYNVVLDEVSVTSKPANYDAWLVAKSLKTRESDVTPFYKSQNLYNEFLFENPQLDYLRVFAKSIPDKDWKKVDDINNKEKNMDQKDKKDDEVKDTKKAEDDMKDEDTKEKSAEDDKKEDDKAEKSYVSKSEFTKAMDSVTKGFAALIKAMEGGMTSKPKDTTNPDETKDKAVGDKATKARDGQENDGGNGDLDAEGKKESDNGAMDQDAPNKKKEDNSGSEEGASKAMDDEEKEEKAMDDEDEKKEKAEGKDEDTKDQEEDYEIKSMDDAMKAIARIGKKSVGVKKSETVKKSAGISSMDKFAATVAVALENIDARFEKSGTSVPGYKQALIDGIKNDPEIQKSIKEFLREPGVKKSVSFGTPYVVDKSGRRFALTATPVQSKEAIAKSTAGKSFKDLYKAEYSAFGQEEQQQ